VYVNESDLDQFTEEAIRQYCAAKLSAAKVPAKVVFDTHLVFNAAGKKSKF
jgi:acyl-CoA synthetase (AMP-forming)/AMP-acid ligase II